MRKTSICKAIALCTVAAITGALAYYAFNILKEDSLESEDYFDDEGGCTFWATCGESVEVLKDKVKKNYYTIKEKVDQTFNKETEDICPMVGDEDFAEDSASDESDKLQDNEIEIQ